MPVLKKTFTLDDGTELVVRQAGGMAKLKIENIQARVFRDHLHFGLDPSEWTQDQQIEFSSALDAEGAGYQDQIHSWVPMCIVEPKDFDVADLTSEELRMILGFVRGDDPDGAPPLEPSSESPQA
tara:strand:+ start:1687 stop:2061 length:375 start_codon:yes stop_codon:yes gene_type:complete